MTAADKVPSLKAYWEDLEPHLPHFLPEEQRVAVAIYHELAKGRAVDTDATVAGSIQTASGDILNLNFGVNQIPLVGSSIVITQYNCKNGVVYTINNPLLPPQK